MRFRHVYGPRPVLPGPTHTRTRVLQNQSQRELPFVPACYQPLGSPDGSSVTGTNGGSSKAFIANQLDQLRESGVEHSSAQVFCDS